MSSQELSQQHWYNVNIRFLFSCIPYRICAWMSFDYHIRICYDSRTSNFHILFQTNCRIFLLTQIFELIFLALSIRFQIERKSNVVISKFIHAIAWSEWLLKKIHFNQKSVVVAKMFHSLKKQCHLNIACMISSLSTYDS